MKFAFVDPPYLGCCKLYQHRHEAPYGCWDDPATHRQLIEWVCASFPDGWALCLSSPALKTILPMCPDDARVMAWIKPFCAFKPNVNPAYAWEPVIVRGGRKRTRAQHTERDWVQANITLRKGLTGAKPEQFCTWIFEVLNMQPDDEFVDIFPGSGAVSKAWASWRRSRQLPMSYA